MSQYSSTPAPPPPPPPPPQPPRHGIVGRLLTSLIGTVLILSLVLNVYLGIIVRAAAVGPSEIEYAKGEWDERIVILPVKGLVDERMQGFIRASLKELRKDPPKALILRVDSGGGYVGPSDRIWKELVKFKEDTNIPIVSSFASTAASGAYYIAAASDHIVIEPTGVTGSIGVIAQAFTVPEMLNKIGVTPETITSTESVNKDKLNPVREWTETDRSVLITILDNAYDRFVEVVIEGRKNVLSADQVRALCTGAIFTAREAEANKLIDQVGYLSDAIEFARTAAGIPSSAEPRVGLMSPRRGLNLVGLLRGQGPDVPSLGADEVRSWMLQVGRVRLAYYMDL